MNDDIVEALVKIANNKKFMKLCEPHVVEPLGLEPWMVKRVVYAIRIFEKVYKETK